MDSPGNLSLTPIKNVVTSNPILAAAAALHRGIHRTVESSWGSCTVLHAPSQRPTSLQPCCCYRDSGLPSSMWSHSGARVSRASSTYIQWATRSLSPRRWCACRQAGQPGRAGQHGMGAGIRARPYRVQAGRDGQWKRAGRNTKSPSPPPPSCLPLTAKPTWMMVRTMCCQATSGPSSCQSAACKSMSKRVGRAGEQQWHGRRKPAAC
jgi:hypothetical protein